MQLFFEEVAIESSSPDHAHVLGELLIVPHLPLEPARHQLNLSIRAVATLNGDLNTVRISKPALSLQQV